jgi:cobalt/nickel transport system permease protein
MMISEHFSFSDSFLHRADPRLKIIAALLITLVIALCRSFVTASCGLLLSLVLIFCARLDCVLVLRRLLVVNFFTAFLWITLPLTYGGQTLMSLGPLAISGPGVSMAALITLKTNCIVLAFLALVSTSTISSLGHALGKLGVPEKLCLLLLFSYRYIIVIGQEFQRLARAAKIRSFVPRTNVHTYRTYAYLFAMTLVKSWNRAQRVQQAMVLRCFSGRFYPLHSYRASPVELILFGGFVAAVIGLALLELHG